MTAKDHTKPQTWLPCLFVSDGGWRVCLAREIATVGRNGYSNVDYEKPVVPFYRLHINVMTPYSVIITLI